MTTTPQALGSLIKRTGVLKSESRKGNSYTYHTEGYSLQPQGGRRYVVQYYPRLQLARNSEDQELAFQARKEESLKKITEALAAKGISFSLQGEILWVDLFA